MEHKVDNERKSIRFDPTDRLFHPDRHPTFTAPQNVRLCVEDVRISSDGNEVYVNWFVVLVMCLWAIENNMPPGAFISYRGVPGIMMMSGKQLVDNIMNFIPVGKQLRTVKVTQELRDSTSEFLHYYVIDIDTILCAVYKYSTELQLTTSLLVDISRHKFDREEDIVAHRPLRENTGELLTRRYIGVTWFDNEALRFPYVDPIACRHFIRFI